MSFNPTPEQQHIMENFRDGRYQELNKVRREVIEKMGLPLLGAESY